MQLLSVLIIWAFEKFLFIFLLEAFKTIQNTFFDDFLFVLLHTLGIPIIYFSLIIIKSKA